MERDNRSVIGMLEAGRLICSMAVLICGRPENNKSGAKCGAKANSRPGPQTKVNAMSQEDFSEKVARHFYLRRREYLT